MAVQGRSAVTQVKAALVDLEAHPEVDVIIVTRGGGSLEDLLPFSDEGLIRTVASMLTPVISAMATGRTARSLDDVADARAATPTIRGHPRGTGRGEVAGNVDALRSRMRSLISGGSHTSAGFWTPRAGAGCSRIRW